MFVGTQTLGMKFWEHKLRLFEVFGNTNLDFVKFVMTQTWASFFNFKNPT
jgi:hypothetical protein